MKRAILLLLLSILTSFSISAQDISGKWNGILKVNGIQLRLVFNITQTEGVYKSTLDSPDQGAKGIPVTSITYKDSLLEIKISTLGVQYRGNLDKNMDFIGNFKQGPLSLPLNLTKKTVEKEKINRPQEPQRPYPYYSEDVRFENLTDSVTLAGTLTLPKKDGFFPVVILISGSGPQNRNEELLGHKPFLILADFLTKNGIAVLRYDDRGTEESTGDFNSANSMDFSKDVEAAIKYLLTRKEINTKQIGLIGHSEGGLIAPIIAAKSKDVSFIVLLAGPGLRGDKLLLLQQELIGKSLGASDAELQQGKEINMGLYDIIINNKEFGLVKSKLTNYLKQVLKDNPNNNIPTGMSEKDYLESQVNQLVNPWMNFFIRYDPVPILEKVDCPVLAINGEKDLQVPPKINLENIKKALLKGGNKDVTTKEVSNLNHLFQECVTGAPNEYASIEQTFSPIALKEILNWIIKQVN